MGVAFTRHRNLAKAFGTRENPKLGAAKRSGSKLDFERHVLLNMTGAQWGQLCRVRAAVEVDETIFVHRGQDG